MDVKDLSSRYQPDLDTELRSMIGDSTLPLYHMMRYHLGWVDVSGQTRLTAGGKLLRPSLCLYSCEAVNGKWQVALPAAVAIELLHNFSLIHDDIEDGDRERRGIPTVWHVWGQPQAINAGDAMHILARLALLKLEEKNVSSEKVIRAARLLDETCLKLCEGQYLDISYEERLDIGIDEYLEMISGKTAALFECSLKLGAMLGTGDEQTIDHLGQFARNLGLAFQVQDDVLGIWGETSVTGKSSATDIMKKKKTLPIIYGLEKADADQKTSLMQIYGQESIAESDVPAVLNILDSLNAKQYAENIVRQYCDKALKELRQARIFSSAKNDLISLTESMIGREY